MVKEVIWSRRAQNDRKEIFTYWNQRNKSNIYSIKLNELFKKAVNLISEYPQLGKHTNNKNVRIKVVRDYLIIYELDEKSRLLILSIWVSRQNPKKMKRILNT